MKFKSRTTMLEERVKANLKNHSTVVFMFSNSEKSYQSSFLSKLNYSLFVHMNDFTIQNWDVYVFKFSNSDISNITHEPTDLDKICDLYNTRCNQIFEHLIRTSQTENFFSTHPIKISTYPIVTSNLAH